MESTNVGKGPRGSKGWDFYEVVMDVPSGTNILSFGAMLNGTGQVWVDDFVLEVVGDNSASHFRTPEPLQPVNLHLEPTVRQ